MVVVLFLNLLVFNSVGHPQGMGPAKIKKNVHFGGLPPHPRITKPEVKPYEQSNQVDNSSSPQKKEFHPVQSHEKKTNENYKQFCMYECQ